MWNQIRGLSLIMAATLFAGCGGEENKPAVSTPEMTPVQQESMKKAMSNGGGPAMIERMKKEGKTKPD
ncbi:MAG: hypothetical protein NT013_01415 [Planctomycetia bacterium]|nr:hypothetical protein [Planctomycetia bacterium]